MRKVIVALTVMLLLSCLLVCCQGCDNPTDGTTVATVGEKKIIEDSFVTFKEGWQKYVNDNMKSEQKDTQYNIVIKDTRLVKIKETDNERFEDIAYIVEFLFYINYFSPDDQYTNYYGMNDNVIVYKDGHMELTSRYISLYMSSTYNWSTTEYVDWIKDFGTDFNRTIVVWAKK